MAKKNDSGDLDLLPGRNAADDTGQQATKSSEQDKASGPEKSEKTEKTETISAESTESSDPRKPERQIELIEVTLKIPVLRNLPENSHIDRIYEGRLRTEHAMRGLASLRHGLSHSGEECGPEGQRQPCTAKRHMLQWLGEQIADALDR